LTVKADEWVYLGTETEDGQKGLYVAARNSQTGRVSEVYPAALSPRVGALVVTPDNRTLIASNWVLDCNGERSGALTSFSLNPRTSQLQLLSQVASGGRQPGPACLLRDGQTFLVANRAAATVGLFILGDAGEAQPWSDLVQMFAPARPSDVTVSSNEAWAVVCDVAGDALVQYPLDRFRRSLNPNKLGRLPLPKKSGPLRCRVSSHNDNFYVLLQNPPSVLVGRFKPQEGLDEVQQVLEFPTLDPAIGPPEGREIYLDAGDRWLYVLAGKTSCVLWAEIDEKTGKLGDWQTFRLKGTDPRAAWFDPHGRWMLVPHRADGFIETVEFDLKTGKPNGNEAYLDVPSPLSVVVVPRQRTLEEPTPTPTP
jgi:6-phosphogluconolactonase